MDAPSITTLEVNGTIVTLADLIDDRLFDTIEIRAGSVRGRWAVVTVSDGTLTTTRFSSLSRARGFVAQGRGWRRVMRWRRYMRAHLTERLPLETFSVGRILEVPHG